MRRVGVEQKISESEQLIRWLDRKLDNLEVQADFRCRAAGACLDLAGEYHKAILVLVARNLNGPAFAVLRLFEEAYVRGVWLHKCAGEKDLRNFRKEKVPTFAELVRAVELLESHCDGILSQVKDRTWKAMNSFTHGGMMQVSRRNTDSTIESNFQDEEVVELLQFADSIGCLVAIAICDLAGDVDAANEILNRIKSDAASEN